MASEWEALRLGDAGVKLIDCDHRTPDATVSGYPYVTIPQMHNGHINISDARRISAADFAEWTRKAKPIANDVVLSRRCNPGETAYVPHGLDFALGQNLVLLRADGSRIFPPFLRWLVRGPEWWEQIGMYLNVGAVFNSLKCADVPKFTLKIPPLAEQRAIAYILGTLDGKIELNRRMNETLEAMARALFKAWFVDFEPVRAKLEGRWRRGQSLPGLPAHLYDLFPDRLVDSELGEIPEGWEVTTLRDVCSYINRGVTPKYVERGGVLVLNQKCIRDFTIDYSKGRLHNVAQKKINGRELEVGDILVNSTGVGTLGRIAQVLRLPETTIVDSHVTVVRAGPRINAMYLGGFMAMKQPVIETMGEGSTGQTELSGKKLGMLNILLPKSGVLSDFAKQTEAIFGKIAESQKDSETLTHFRDTLLPKLISGELRVPDVGRIVGAIV